MNKLMITTINVFFIFIIINSVQALTKDGIDVTLISNTNYCEDKCKSVYEICYPNVNQLSSDLEMKFNKIGMLDLEPDNYLERFEIENIDTSFCKRLTVHGKKGKFENVDNIPCINDVCFNEFAWWNTTWKTAVLITNLTEATYKDNYEINVTFTNTDIPYAWFQVADFGDLRVTNGTEPNNDSGIEQSFFRHQDCDSLNTSQPCVIWVRGFENQSSMIFWLNASGVPDVSNGWTTFDVFDDFDDGSINTSIFVEIDANARIQETGGVIETKDEADTWVSGIYTLSNFTFPHVVEIDHKRTSADGGSYAFGVSVGEHLPTAWGTGEHQIFTVSDATPKKMQVYERTVSVHTSSMTTAVNSWYHLEVRLENASASTYWLEYNQEFVGAVPNVTLLPIVIGKYNDGSHHYDNFWVRDYIPNPPTWNFSTGYSAPPVTPVTPTPNVTNGTYDFVLTDIFYISTCLNDTLLTEWNYSGGYESQLIACPNGCIDNFNAHGGVCSEPDYINYALTIIIIVVVLILMIYFSKKK